MYQQKQLAMDINKAIKKLLHELDILRKNKKVIFCSEGENEIDLEFGEYEYYITINYSLSYHRERGEGRYGCPPSEWTEVEEVNLTKLDISCINSEGYSNDQEVYNLLTKEQEQLILNKLKWITTA